MTLDEWAAQLAASLLAEDVARWRHTLAVVERARALSGTVPAEDREILVAAAFLHDIGYAPALVGTGLHALDGALHLRALDQERLAGLVAYHSSSRHEAELCGELAQLKTFTNERSAVSDALTYADVTTSPEGERSTLDERLANVRERRGPDAPVTRAMELAMGELIACAQAVERRLKVPRGSRYSMTGAAWCAR